MNRKESVEAAWDLASSKYAKNLNEDIQALQAGVLDLSQAEIDTFSTIGAQGRAVHLQCSHGQDTLSLLQLGFDEVVGVDLSEKMLLLARKKTQALGAAASWIQSDVLETPESLNNSASLIFTGSGALPWISNIERWAAVVARILQPGGTLFVSEGHPLGWVWDVDAHSYQLRSDGRSHFDTEPRPNDDFPASAVRKYAAVDQEAPLAWEYQWGLGEIVTAVCDAGLIIRTLEESPRQFWPRLTNISDEQLARLPNTYRLVAQAPG